MEDPALLATNCGMEAVQPTACVLRNVCHTGNIEGDA